LVYAKLQWPDNQGVTIFVQDISKIIHFPNSKKNISKIKSPGFFSLFALSAQKLVGICARGVQGTMTRSARARRFMLLMYHPPRARAQVRTRVHIGQKLTRGNSRVFLSVFWVIF